MPTSNGTPSTAWCCWQPNCCCSGVRVLTSLVSLATFGLGCALSMVVIFIWVAILGVHVVAIIKAMGGTRLNIPGISEYANRF